MKRREMFIPVFPETSRLPFAGSFFLSFPGRPSLATDLNREPSLSRSAPSVTTVSPAETPAWMEPLRPECLPRSPDGPLRSCPSFTT
jgi:hypothetical protein